MFFHFCWILIIVDLALIDFFITILKIFILLLYGFDFFGYINHFCSHRFDKWTKFSSTIAKTLILAYAVYALIWGIAILHLRLVVLEIIIELFFFWWSGLHLKTECFFFYRIPFIFLVTKTSYSKFWSSYSDFGSCWRFQKMSLVGFANEFLFTISLCFQSFRKLIFKFINFIQSTIDFFELRQLWLSILWFTLYIVFQEFRLFEIESLMIW